MVEKAAITSQKAAERAEETLKKQRIDSVQSVTESNTCKFFYIDYQIYKEYF